MAQTALRVEVQHDIDPTLYNEDLAPVSSEQRTWGWLNFTTVWMGMVHNIVAYETAASLLSLGMSVWQALLTVIVANAVLIVAMCLNSVAGARYGLPFPVLVRAAFGHKGAQIPVFVRAFVAIFWFSIQAYAGSEAVGAVFGALIPGWASLGHYHIIGMGLNTAIAVALFWLLHIWVVSHGINRVKYFELWAGPLVIVLGLCLVVWSITVAHGFGPAFTQPSKLHGVAFWQAFGLSVTGLVGTWSTLVLNIPDLTRFSRSQKDQIVGQAIGLPGTAILFSVMSIVITSGTLIAFGTAVTDPVQLLGKFNNPIVLMFGAFALLIATLSVNVAANVVSPAYDLVNLFPKKLNFVRAGVISVVIGLCFAPWLWYDNGGVIFSVLNAIGGGLGPVAGIMLADFFMIKRRKYDVLSFYRSDSEYRYTNGWNLRAIGALVIGLIAAFIGLVVPVLSILYTYSWFIGVIVGGVAYVLLMRSSMSVEAIEPVAVGMFEEN
ncbi:putative allantoin permease [Alicyclobacillus acidoterrestris]|nr:putative allantoin permease [Alicyclobacillus acidoterrestris]